MKINLNCDIGEAYGRWHKGADSELMPLIGSANIACGQHAGDPTIMASTVGLAIENGVSIGAHPGFNDIWGFGRREIRMSPRDLEHLVAYQIGALQAIAGAQAAAVTHVKPHGSLNNMAHDDLDYATAIGRAIKSVDPDLIYVANANSQMTIAADRLGLRAANESYVDRLYDDKGKMLSRTLPGSVITSPERAAAHVVRILTEGAIVSVNGVRIPAEVHTFCTHGDEPTAVALLQAVHERLSTEGIETVSLPELIS